VNIFKLRSNCNIRHQLETLKIEADAVDGTEIMEIANRQHSCALRKLNVLLHEYVLFCLPQAPLF